jgi:hypothetical protein
VLGGGWLRTPSPPPPSPSRSRSVDGVIYVSYPRLAHTRVTPPLTRTHMSKHTCLYTHAPTHPPTHTPTHTPPTHPPHTTHTTTAALGPRELGAVRGVIDHLALLSAKVILKGEGRGKGGICMCVRVCVCVCVHRVQRVQRPFLICHSA